MSYAQDLRNRIRGRKRNSTQVYTPREWESDSSAHSSRIVNVTENDVFPEFPLQDFFVVMFSFSVVIENTHTLHTLRWKTPRDRAEQISTPEYKFKQFVYMCYNLIEDAEIKKLLGEAFKVNTFLGSDIGKDEIMFPLYPANTKQISRWVYKVYSYVHANSSETPNIPSYTDMMSTVYKFEGINLTTWGRSMWNLIHHFALVHDISFAENVKVVDEYDVLFGIMLSTLDTIIPCDACRRHYIYNLKTIEPLDSYINTGSVFVWTVKLHNTVNVSKRFRTVSVDKALSEHYSPPSSLKT